MNEIVFTHPYGLLLLEFIPVMIIYYFRTYKKTRAVIQVSNITAFLGVKKTARQYLVHVPFVLRMLCFGLLLIAMADPRRYVTIPSAKKNVRLVLAVSNALPMLAQDPLPNRLEVVKKASFLFLDDLISVPTGLVVFSGTPSLTVPVTTDKQTLINAIEEITVEKTAKDASFPEAIRLAINHLTTEKNGQQKIIIGITSDRGKGGYVVEDAVRMAVIHGVTVYLIKLGSDGLVQMPVYHAGKIHFIQSIAHGGDNEDQKIAEGTGGLYLRATNEKELTGSFLKISHQINLSKTAFGRTSSGVFPFAALAAIVLCVELFLRYSLLKSLP